MKKRNLKRVLTLVLTAALVLGCVSVSGIAAEENETDAEQLAGEIVEEETEDAAESTLAESMPDDPEYYFILNQEVEEESGIAPLSVNSTGTIKNWGIDVSYYQETIDWSKVKASGVDFAFIRVGYRGYTDGVIYEDTCAKTNIKNALAAGVKVGVYFFSTALNETEAKEEAQFVVNFLNENGYSTEDITYPVVYDHEGYGVSGYRNKDLSTSQRTKNATAFLDYVQGVGYKGMIYSSKSHFANNTNWETSTLEEKYLIWVAQYFYADSDNNLYTTFQQSIDAGKSTNYTGAYAFWQFTSSGSVDGITGNGGKVDLDFEYETTGEVSTTVSNLATPTLTSATSSSGKNTVKWDSVSGASGYRVFRKKSGESWGNIGVTTSTSYTDSDVDAGTTYYYTVRAYTGNQSTALKNTYDSKYWSSYNSTGLSVKTSGIVATPTLTSATSSGGSNVVKWSAVSNASGYRVFRKTSGGSWGNIGLTTSTSYTDSNVNAGTTYYYTVRAYKGSQSTALSNAYKGTYWSAYDTSGVSVTTKAALDTPSLTSATSSGGNITVKWSSVSGASGYRVFRKTSGGSWSNIGLTTSTSYTDTGLDIGTTYYYTVRAYKGSQSTALKYCYDSKYWSSYNSSGVSAKGTGVVSAPTLKSATSSNGNITVKWSSVSGASGYRVFRKTSGGSWSNIGLTTSTSYTDTNLDIGTTYYYTVRAYKGSQSTALKHTYKGNYWSSYDSSGVSAKGTSVLSTPTLKSATSSNGNITVKWSSVSGASGYRVFRKTSGGSWSNIGLTTSTSYTDTNLDIGTTYYYTVRAYKGSQSTALKHCYKGNYWSYYDTAGVSPNSN